MKLLMMLIFLQSSLSYAFINPTRISCKNSGEVKVSSEGYVKTYYKKDFSENLSQAAILEFFKGKKTVAKLFPQNGLDYVIKDKNFNVETDHKTYWILTSHSGLKQLFNCELRDE